MNLPDMHPEAAAVLSQRATRRGRRCPACIGVGQAVGARAAGWSPGAAAVVGLKFLALVFLYPLLHAT